MAGQAAAAKAAPTQEEINAQTLKHIEDEEVQIAFDKSEADKRPNRGAPLKPEPIILEPSCKGPRDLKRMAEAWTHWDAMISNCPVDMAMQIFQMPKLLWGFKPRLTRFDLVTFHDELWTWEVTGRIMKMDNELQVVILDPVTALVRHKINASNIDYDAIRIEHHGATAKWCLIYGRNVLSDKHETQEAAQRWLARKKLVDSI